MTDNQQMELVDDFDVLPVEQSTFSMPRHFVQNSGLVSKMGPTSFALYTIIRSFVNPSNGVAWPGNDLLGSIIGRKHDTIGRAIEELSDLRLMYQDWAPGGNRTRGLRLIDWYPAHVYVDHEVGVVRGKIAIPFLPSRAHRLLEAARAAAYSPTPQIILRAFKGFEHAHYMTTAINGERVFLMVPGIEKYSRPFFMGAGVPPDEVTRFYAQDQEKYRTEEAKRIAATFASDDFEGWM